MRLAHRWPLAIELAAVAAIIAAHVYVLTRLVHARTVFDEGVYLLSIDALGRGQALGRDVFASQGPDFYVLLRAIGGIFGVSVGGVRLGFVAVSALGCLLAYVLGRRAGGPLSGLACAGLVAIAPRLSYLGARIYADLPAMVLVLASLCFVVYRRPAAAGAAFGAALLVKLSAITALPTVAVLLALEHDRFRRLAYAAAGAVAVFAVTALVFVRDLGSLWTDAVTYHLRSRAQIGLSGRHELTSFFDPKTPFFWFVVAGGVASVVLWRRMWPWWLWAVCAAVFILRYQPLRENESLVMPYALAIPAGLALGLAALRLPRRVLAPAIAVAAAGLAAGWVQQLHLVERDIFVPEDASLIHAAAALDRVTKPGEVVISDQPIVAFLAHRPVPGNYVDTASLRWNTRTLDDNRVVHDARSVAAVVAGRAFANRPELMARLRPLFSRRLVLPGATIFYGRVGSGA